ncbi:HGL196Wp [Eremothecium sinecaudum]|uniref:HGL196Wp n=1 Tax=Eremothecium sinecaudum TaxID=45286 RepID=A0A0X8HVA2_9SACH|nr:HGL196Wp [Eremothecium sinecaudum]AMD22144.1 HGL196Wp [Eremothecium sinecaudum]
MAINNPIPSSLKAESKKAAKVLASFIKPKQFLGADEVIPPSVLKNAKGLAIITVLKAGFLFSGRAGSGIIVARLRDGSWSAPSAIALAGAGAGGMIGVELTDFVFILNTKDAVKSFSQLGSITLGGNVSVAAGPLGRNAEAAATASLGGVAAVFSYSKTKGLFAGVSVEGSVIIERRDANRKFYGRDYSAQQILTGRMSSSLGIDSLYRVLNSPEFDGRPMITIWQDSPDTTVSAEYDDDYADDHYYTDTSNTNSANGSFSSARKSNSSYSQWRGGENQIKKHSSRYGSSRSLSHDSNNYDWEGPTETFRQVNSATGLKPTRPTSTKPDFGALAKRQNRSQENVKVHHRPAKGIPKAVAKGIPKAVALYTFRGELLGDLSFRKGDVITIIKRSRTQNDWWTGRANGREGIFPANYVELV